MNKKEYAVTVEEHKCKMIENSETVWLSKIKFKGISNWYWNFRKKSDEIEIHQIGFCPYCGKELE